MIINETVSSPVITSIAAAPSRFKIKASAKAFKILSGFYSEPILAIPRELGANAWDSHVKSGNTNKMFEVHAPNNLEPWFSVRDFGTGLSPADIDTIYTTYFESTKTNENDSDGCMGLGSKTPFNYTDNFNVTSFFNGKKHVYNCFIDESGAPNIMPVVTEDTTEHNGLEVKFGVKMTDITMWVDKILRAYEPFRFRPVIKGANIAYPERVHLYQGKSWAYRKNEGYHSSRNCNAFMGNYCYPVSHTAIRSAIYASDESNQYDIEKIFSNGGFDFFFEIGDLEVAPNKEQLQYEDGNSTSKALIAIAKRAVKELKDQVMQSVDVPKTRWEALSMFNKYNSYNSPYANVRNIIGDIPVSFGGEKITQGNENVARVHSNAKCLSANNSIDPFQLHVLERCDGRCKKTGTYYPQSDGKDVIIFYTNGDSIKNARLRHYLKTTYATTPMPLCYVITDTSAGNKTLLAHKKYFGWDDAVLKNIESLPKPPPVPRAKRVIGTDEVYYADLSDFITPKVGRYGSPFINWRRKSETVDSASTYYYVDFLYSDPVWNEKRVTDEMSDIARVLVDNKLHGTATIIYGINRKNANLLKVGKWINVVDLVEKHVKANKDKYEDQQYLRTYKLELEQMNGLHSKINRQSAFIKNLENETTRKLFQAFLSAHTTTSRQIEKHPDEDFYRLFGVSAKKHSDVPIDVTEFKKLLKDKYMGIFDLVYEYADSIAGLARIINYIDEKS